MPTNRLQDWSTSAKMATKNRWSDKVLEDSSQSKWLRHIEQFISDHPGKTVVAALTVGLVVGWLGKRK